MREITKAHFSIQVALNKRRNSIYILCALRKHRIKSDLGDELAENPKYNNSKHVLGNNYFLSSAPLSLRASLKRRALCALRRQHTAAQPKQQTAPGEAAAARSISASAGDSCTPSSTACTARVSASTSVEMVVGSGVGRRGWV